MQRQQLRACVGTCRRDLTGRTASASLHILQLTCPAPGPSSRLNRALAAGGASAHTAVGGLGYSSWSRSDPATRYGRWDR